MFCFVRSGFLVCILLTTYSYDRFKTTEKKNLGSIIVLLISTAKMSRIYLGFLSEFFLLLRCGRCQKKVFTIASWKLLIWKLTKSGGCVINIWDGRCVTCTLEPMQFNRPVLWLPTRDTACVTFTVKLPIVLKAFKSQNQKIPLYRLFSFFLKTII